MGAVRVVRESLSYCFCFFVSRKIFLEVLLNFF